MKGFKLTGEKLVNLGLLMMSVFYLTYSLNHYKLGTVRMPKEGFMPMIIGVGATLISAFLTVQSFMNKGRKPAATAAATTVTATTTEGK